MSIIQQSRGYTQAATAVTMRWPTLALDEPLTRAHDSSGEDATGSDPKSETLCEEDLVIIGARLVMQRAKTHSALHGYKTTALRNDRSDVQRLDQVPHQGKLKSEDPCDVRRSVRTECGCLVCGLEDADTENPYVSILCDRAIHERIFSIRVEKAEAGKHSKERPYDT